MPLISPTSARCSAITAWNVYGTSYGSYLAQTLMRDHPDGIRSVVLDSVLPTTYSVARKLVECARRLRQSLPGLRGGNRLQRGPSRVSQETFTGLVNKLEAEPLTTTVSDPTTGENLEVVLDGGALVDWLRNQNYGVPCSKLRRTASMGSPPAAPKPSQAIAMDRASRAPPPGPNVPALGYGLAFGVSCREDYPFATPEELAAAGRDAFPDYPVSVTNARVSAVGRISTKTAATSGRSPPPLSPCTSPSRAPSRRSSSPAASIR